MCRGRVVYVESIARVYRLSLSGKILYHARLAAPFFVQVRVRAEEGRAGQGAACCCGLPWCWAVCGAVPFPPLPLPTRPFFCLALQWEELRERYPRAVYAGRLM